MRSLLLMFVFTAAASAQLIGLGVKGGVPLSDALETSRQGNLRYLANTERWTVGPAVELRLPLRLSVEFNALYRRFDYELATNADPASQTRAASWQFPVLAKYRLLPGPLAPYISAGPSFLRITDISNIGQVLRSSNPPELEDRSNVGAAIAGGVQLRVGRLRITPEIRYTRWARENFRDNLFDLLRFNRNQADFLIGFIF